MLYIDDYDPQKEKESFNPGWEEELFMGGNHRGGRGRRIDNW